jgi:GTP-binding protein
MLVEFVGSCTSRSLPRPDLPEIAVGGRSNVGKSSFINSLVGRPGIAKVSARPGMTRTLNLYRCANAYLLVDLPGYGYSSAPRMEQQRWSRDVDAYLTGRPSLTGIILVGDIRHFPTRSDLEALNWLTTLGKPVLAVLTKADKMGRGAVMSRTSHISGVLAGLGVQYRVFSAKTGLGRKEVRRWIEATTGSSSSPRDR